MRIAKIPEEWILSRGSGITVAVVDSHILESSKVFKNNVIKYYKENNFTTYGFEHCTSVCSIISKVAPLCKIIVSQALIDRRGTCEGLYRALEKIREDSFDVLNISLSYDNDNVKINSLIKEFCYKSCIIASVPNTGSDSFPACLDNVVSVSAMKHPDYNADIYCEDNFCDTEIKKTGNSMSTAFVSGLFALAKSYDKTITKESFINQLL